MNNVALHDCPFVAWRNGGGRTRELVAWPSAQDWQVRVSVAEIEADGPFSAFPGIERAFAVLDGAGVVLTLPTGNVRLGQHDDALLFDGAATPVCRLVDGPTRDLNLMVRSAFGRARMQRGVTPAAPWRGLFAAGTLWWTDRPDEALPAMAGWHLAADHHR
jgi:environmental stress-induced protein Ves